MTELVPAKTEDLTVYTNPESWTQLQRVAKAFAASELVPKHMRNLANVTVALLMAREMDENPLTVMQSIYFIQGKPGWSASYMIARANASGLFLGRIGWEIEGEGAALVVTAHATVKTTGDRISIPVSMAQAKAEGWTSNKKYQTLPELMLRYRSATLLIRLYCPEVMLGYHTAEELQDVHQSSGSDILRPTRATSPAPRSATARLLEEEPAEDQP